MEKVYWAIKAMKDTIYNAQWNVESWTAKAALKFAEELDNVIQSKLWSWYSKFKSEYSALKSFEDNIWKQLKKYYWKKDSWISWAADNEFLWWAFIDAVRWNYLWTAKNIYQEISKNMEQAWANPNKLLYDIFQAIDKTKTWKTSIINQNLLNNVGATTKAITNVWVNKLTNNK